MEKDFTWEREKWPAVFFIWRELATLMIRWLQEANERVVIGENGRLAVASNRGALDRLLCLVTQRLPPGKTKSLGGPALEVAPPAV